MLSGTDVAIIGAGPYGLSIAAHLRAGNVDHRVIGSPMHFWRAHMPFGMQLKSEGFASNLYDQKRELPLKRFCEERRIAYADLGIPVHLETFTAYGRDFQKRFVPEAEDKRVEFLERSPAGFQLHLDDGTSFTARRAIVAVGVDHFRSVPAQLAHLPAEFGSHSSEHNSLDRFVGRDITVIGAGSSAIDLAVLLSEKGANVRLVARTNSIKVHGKMQLPRPLWDRISQPMSGIGPGWKHIILSDAPTLVHLLPSSMRLMAVKRILGPAGGWFMKERLAHVPLLLGYRLRRAECSDSRVHLEMVANDGTQRRLQTEHVIAATGFSPDLHRLPFLSDEIRLRLRAIENTPVLSSYFESSVRGLYFVGAISANSFGPVMRFAVGAKFTARQISKHVALTSRVRTAMRLLSASLPDVSAQ